LYGGWRGVGVWREKGGGGRGAGGWLWRGTWRAQRLAARAGTLGLWLARQGLSRERGMGHTGVESIDLMLGRWPDPI
jgi:hypothetical protein